MTENNIYPIFDRMLSRQDKEELLKQHSVMIWFTGLSGSGKSTIAIALERELHKRGLLCRILDGDNIRSGINNNLGFTEADRHRYSFRDAAFQTCRFGVGTFRKRYCGIITSYYPV